MITNFNIKNLFALPVYIVKIDPNSYDKKAFMDVVKHNYKIDPTRCNHHPQNDEFGNLHHSFADVGNKKFKDVDLIYPVTLELTIDGISGISWGNAVHTAFISKQYKDNVVFQVTSVNHTLDNSDWVTTIQTVCRIAGKG